MMSMIGDRRIKANNAKIISITRLTKGIPLRINFNVIIIQIVPNMLDVIEFCSGRITHCD